MTMRKTLIFASLTLFSITVLRCEPAYADEIELVNRPVNTYGLTGLLLTTAPYTLPDGMVEVAASGLSENSTRPAYTITETPFSITTGIGANKEIALRGSYFIINEGSAPDTHTERKTGDVQLSGKWNFFQPQEYSNAPGVALLLTGIFPSKTGSDALAGSVSHWGVRAGLSTGTELNWKYHVIGIYADAQIVGQDPLERRLRDIYEMVNAGVLFPISKYQNLQMLFEYSLVNGKNRTSISGGDNSQITYGLRLVSEQFNLTMGSQFIHKKSENYDNTGRLIGVVSMKF
jgi:hypothetical protein